MVKFSTRAVILIVLSTISFQWMFDSYVAHRQASAGEWSRPAIIMTAAFMARLVLFLFTLSVVYRYRRRIRAASLVG